MASILTTLKEPIMSDERESIHGEWSGSVSFFLAASGAAVGLGNIWKFPYVVGENGGGAFILFYLLFLLLIGLPLMMSEVLIGRRGRQTPVNSFYILASEDQKNRRWAWLGGISAIAGFIILSYYSVVAGEVMAYTIRAVSGTFTNQSADGIRSIYNNFRTNPEGLLAWHTIFMVITCIIVARGVRHGLEKTVKWILPVIILILIAMVAYSITTGAFIEGASYLVDFDFKKLFFLRDETGSYVLNSHGEFQFTFKGILTAMGHAFFTLSVGVGVMIIFGSYLSRNSSISRVCFAVALIDTFIALLAGLAIFPIVFSYGLSVAQGPGLVFTTLPIAFGAMSYGNLIGSVFFLLLFLAALTSAIALIEPAVTWLIEKRQINRVNAVIQVGVSCWFLGIISVFSLSGLTLRQVIYNLGSYLDISDIDIRHRIFDLTGFQILDGIVTLVILPLAGLLIAVFVGWIMSPESSGAELNCRKPFQYRTWQILVRYVAPALILIIFIAGLIEWVEKYLLYQPVV